MRSTLFLTLTLLAPSVAAEPPTPAPLGMEIGGQCATEINPENVTDKRVDRVFGGATYRLTPNAAEMEGVRLIFVQCNDAGTLGQVELFVDKSQGLDAFRSMASEIAATYPSAPTDEATPGLSAYAAEGVSIEVFAPEKAYLLNLSFTASSFQEHQLARR